MAKSKNVNLGGEPDGQAVDLSNVDLTPTGGSALDRLRAEAEPKTTTPRTRSRVKTDATAVAKSLDTDALGDAYSKTRAIIARTEKPSRVGPERARTNLNNVNIEGMAPATIDRLDEEPTNVPRNFDKDGAFRNQIHGDYSHFAKVTNLINFLGEKAGAAQDALKSNPEAAAKFDDIHKILAVASGHLIDARNAHQKGETGLSRINPETGLSSPVGRQFSKEGKEDPFGGQAQERGIGYNPIAKVNQTIGEPQLRSEGLTTQALDSKPFGAVPHFHRAIQHIVTAANLLQGNLADVSSDQRLGAGVKAWDGRYDEVAKDPDTVAHATELTNEYANSAAKGGSEIVRANDEIAEQSPGKVAEMFNKTNTAYKTELAAKVQQAEIHAGLVSKGYREIFGGELATRREEADRRTEELKTLPVIASPASLGRGKFTASRREATPSPTSSIIEKTQNATDQDYAKESADVGVENSKVAIRQSLPALQKAAADAAAAGKIDSATLNTINGHARDAFASHNKAVTNHATPIALPEEPVMTYDSSRDPRFLPKNQLAYDKMTTQEKAAERNSFLKSRGQTLPAWQKESAAFEEKLPVIQAQDALALANHKSDTARAIVNHHTVTTTAAKSAIDSVSAIHKLLTAANVITPSAPTPQPADITGIPTPETFARASAGRGRAATRDEAMAQMQSENEKAQAEAAAKAAVEAAKPAAIEAARPDRSSAMERAKEFGFYAGDEETARGFLEAGGNATPGSKAVGVRRASFLGALGLKNAVEYSPTPRTVAPGKAIFIAPNTGIPATPASVNPRTAKRQAAAAARVAGQANDSARRRLAGQVNNVGLNLEDVTAPEPRTSRAARVSRETEAGSEFSAGNLGEDPKLFDKQDETAFQVAKRSLEGINSANEAFDAANSVGTTIQPTRRTRK